jgi:hypothetical protein
MISPKPSSSRQRGYAAVLTVNRLARLAIVAAVQPACEPLGAERDALEVQRLADELGIRTAPTSHPSIPAAFRAAGRTALRGQQLGQLQSDGAAVHQVGSQDDCAARASRPVGPDRDNLVRQHAHAAKPRYGCSLRRDTSKRSRRRLYA